MPCTPVLVKKIIHLPHPSCLITPPNLKVDPPYVIILHAYLKQVRPFLFCHQLMLSWHDELHLGHEAIVVPSQETLGWEPLKVYLVVNVYENLG